MEPTSPSFPFLSEDISASKMRATVISWQRFARFIMAPLMAVLSRGIRFDFTACKLTADARYVVVSNHQSQLDAFVLLAAFTPAMIRKLQPFRAMTMNRYLTRGIVKRLALNMGCFPAKSHPSLPSGIDFSAELVNARQTVFICPEGNLSLPGERAARPGVATLAKLPDVLIIPAHIQWTRYGRWRRSFKLVYGKPFDGSKMSAQQILDACYALPLG